MASFRRCAFWAMIAIGMLAPVAAATAAVAVIQPPDPPPVAIETSLSTDKENVPQCALDGKDDTWFRSDRAPKAEDTFTLVFAPAITIDKVEVLTGKPDGQDAIGAAVLEMSTDGKAFTAAGKFAAGTVKASSGGKEAKALRIRFTADGVGPIAIREIALGAKPEVPVFKYPIQVDLDVSQTPDMKEWAEKAQLLIAKWYGTLGDVLVGGAYAPPRRIALQFEKSSKGIAAAAGAKIFVKDGWFKDHPDDVGALLHEAVHVVQSYRGGVPGWLTEGIADYTRFWVYEPQMRQARLDPNRIKYTDSYRITGAFLAWIVRNKDKDFAKKLNVACHNHQYKDELWKEYTGKDLDTLFDEFKTSLAAK
jgi:hypothetical protein